MHNKSNESRTVVTALTICIASGAGPKSGTCIDQPIQTIVLEPGKGSSRFSQLSFRFVFYERFPIACLDKLVQFKLIPQQYMKYGPQDNIVIKYFIYSQIKETGQIYTRDNNFIFIKDDVIKPVRHTF